MAVKLGAGETSDDIQFVRVTHHLIAQVSVAKSVSDEA